VKPQAGYWLCFIYLFRLGGSPGAAWSRMRTITAIEVQKKNPDRVNIYLDDQFAFGLSRINAAWLKVGQQLGEEKISALQEAEAREAALQKALRFLGHRSRSVDEVRKNLEKHEIPPEVIEETITRLEREKLIGDANFAREWVENRNTFRPRGKRALSFELHRKGLSDAVIHETLDEGIDEEALAFKAARIHARKLKGLEWNKFREKMGGHLGRRGFGFDVIIPVTRRVWEETQNQVENLDNEEQL
jgi:regulatory protein